MAKLGRLLVDEVQIISDNLLRSSTTGPGPLNVSRIIGQGLHLDKYPIVIFPIVISMDTELHTILVHLEMQFHRERN